MGLTIWLSRITAARRGQWIRMLFNPAAQLPAPLFQTPAPSLSSTY